MYPAKNQGFNPKVQAVTVKARSFSRVKNRGARILFLYRKLNLFSRPS